MARSAGKRAGVAHPQSESAGTLVAGIVSLGAPARREPQADAHLRRTRLRRQAREPGVDGADRRRQNRTSLRASVEGFAERPSLSVHPRAGSVRRDVRLAGRPLHAPVTQSPGAPGPVSYTHLRAHETVLDLV